MTRKSDVPAETRSLHLHQAENLFVALVQNRETGYYAGRIMDASEEELRSIFGLAVAALRQSSRGQAADYPDRGSVFETALNLAHHHPSAPEEEVPEALATAEKRRRQSSSGEIAKKPQPG